MSLELNRATCSKLNDEIKELKSFVGDIVGDTMFSNNLVHTERRDRNHYKKNFKI